MAANTIITVEKALVRLDVEVAVAEGVQIQPLHATARGARAIRRCLREEAEVAGVGGEGRGRAMRSTIEDDCEK
jgi:hypothetical protein